MGARRRISLRVPQLIMLQPNNLEITGRDLTDQELKLIGDTYPHRDFDKRGGYEAMTQWESNIVAAQDIEAAHAFVQWWVNYALRAFDNMVEEITTGESQPLLPIETD